MRQTKKMSPTNINKATSKINKSKQKSSKKDSFTKFSSNLLDGNPRLILQSSVYSTTTFAETLFFWVKRYMDVDHIAWKKNYPRPPFLLVSQFDSSGYLAEVEIFHSSRSFFLLLTKRSVFCQYQRIHIQIRRQSLQHPLHLTERFQSYSTIYFIDSSRLSY